MVEEMTKLRQILDKLEIEWEDASDTLPSQLSSRSEDTECYVIDEEVMQNMLTYHIDRTHFYYKKHFFSAINGFGTYGGYLLSPDENQGLLELMIDDVEPIGYLTADEVISIVQSHNTTSGGAIEEKTIINNLLADAFSVGGRDDF